MQYQPGAEWRNEEHFAISLSLKAEFNRRCVRFSQKYEFLHTFQTGRFLMTLLSKTGARLPHSKLLFFLFVACGADGR